MAEPETVHLFVHHRSEQRNGRGVGGRRAPGILREQLTGFVLARVADHVHTQVALAEDRDRVGGRRGVEQVPREHRVEGDRRDRSPLGEDRTLERLGVVRPLRCGGVGERLGQSPQALERRVGGLSAAGGHGRPPYPALVGPQADRRGPRLQHLRELRGIALGEVELRQLDLRLDRARRLVEAVEQRTELERREQSVDGVGIEGPPHAVLRPDVQIEVGHDPRELLVQTEPIDRVADVLLELASEVVQVCDEVLDRSPFLDELRRGLLPHTRHARDVVRRVALQGDVVEVLGG